jgi:integrase
MPRPHTGYLYQRPGSTQWWIRFRYPADLGLKAIQKSLGTPDRKEAEVLALPLIAEHRRRLYDAEQRRKGFIRATEMDLFYPLGDSVLDDGTKVHARMDMVRFERDGRVWEDENFLTTRTIMRPVSADPDWVPPAPKSKKPVDNDREHIERWISHKNVNPYLQKEAWEAFRLFKDLTGGKLFKDADRDDGRKLVAHLFDKLGNKRATVQKKVGHLCAAVNIAISEGKLKFNPFEKIIPRINDEKKRMPVSDGDMNVIRDGLHTLKPEERLLFLICATTGMRRGEAYSISAERTVDGLRCVTVGTKTEQSLREIPLPVDLLPHLPARITGPLFTKDLKNLGRETLRSIRRLGIENPDACLHGLRHRAADRLKNVARIDGHRCEDSMRHAILGHEDKTVADNYGVGYAMRQIKPWIDQIGYGLPTTDKLCNCTISEFV